LVFICICLGGAGVLLLGAALACHLVRKKGKKKHNFGIKKSWHQDRSFLKFRKPTPVTIPDKGSHYLKKSPSPTGHKSPPGVDVGGVEGVTLSPVNEYLQRKALITTTQQTNNNHEHDEPDHEVQGVVEGPLEAYDETKLGRLFFTVKYSFEKNALIVTVNKCTNLPAKDSLNRSSDPYVKLQLLPEKQHKVKTRVLRRTLNPVYDEDFTFYGVHFNQLPILTLHFVVLSFDRYSRDDVVGEVMVELENIDLTNTDSAPLPLVREITPRSMKLKNLGRGEILLSLCYQPAASRVTVVVLKARNLPKMDITGLSDPYVKIYLLFNNQRIAKKKTHVKKRTLNPVFNESFVFDLPKSEDGLKSVQLEFMLLDWDRVTKNEVIGRLDLGGEGCEGSALHHWEEIQNSPRRQIAEWHKLKPE
ncbi:synaptotagmin-11, partial [Eurytemora carolleeae]|uniref:synaptotagmin-11 n=1 Tax=Eurytemora carolleeae TaxID=1294199 RepID=UPI000C75E6B3